MIPLPLLSSVQPESFKGCDCLSVNSLDPYEARLDAVEKMLLRNLKPSHITVTYVTVTQTELSQVTMNMCQMNILIKKNVSMSVEMKMILMEIT